MPTNLTPEAKPTTLAEMASRNPNFILVDEAPLTHFTAPQSFVDNAQTQTDHYTANIPHLLGKHGEYYRHEADVKRAIDKNLALATHFFDGRPKENSLSLLRRGGKDTLMAVARNEDPASIRTIFTRDVAKKQLEREVAKQASKLPTLRSRGESRISPALSDILPPPSLESLSISELLARIDPRLKSEVIDTEWNPIPLIGHKPRQDLESASTAELLAMIDPRLKEIPWSKEAKRESSKMYRLLEGDKPSTLVRSNQGDILIDSAFATKERSKHLDNPAFRGMITTPELLSYPKVARNVTPSGDRHGNTWRVIANDETPLRYGTREYGGDKRLVRAEYNGRIPERGGRTSSTVLESAFNAPAPETLPPQDLENLTTAELVEMVVKPKRQRKAEIPLALKRESQALRASRA